MAARFVNVDRQTPLFLPCDLREWLPADHLVTLVQEAVDELWRRSARSVMPHRSGTAQPEEQIARRLGDGDAARALARGHGERTCAPSGGVGQVGVLLQGNAARHRPRYGDRVASMRECQIGQSPRLHHLDERREAARYGIRPVGHGGGRRGQTHHGAIDPARARSGRRDLIPHHRVLPGVERVTPEAHRQDAQLPDFQD